MIVAARTIIDDMITRKTIFFLMKFRKNLRKLTNAVESEVNAAFFTAVERFPFNNAIVILIVQAILCRIVVRVACPRYFFFCNSAELQKVRLV